MKISASLLSCEILNLLAEITLLEKTDISSIHVDVMDGHFVPNLAFGINFIEKISKITSLPIDVHLMVEKPDLFIETLCECNISTIIIHIENNRNLGETINYIKSKNIKVGIAINPLTSPHSVLSFLESIDEILVMGVNPGFGGQPLILSTIEKLDFFKSVYNRVNCTISIDGGMTEKTVQLVMGKVDKVVVGSYLFDNIEYGDRMKNIRDKVRFLCSLEGK